MPYSTEMKSIIVVACCASFFIAVNGIPSKDSLNDIIDHMNGEKNIQLDEDYKDTTVLFLGISGSGKSTLVQFVAGDNSKLFAKQNAGKEFIIEDRSNRISNSKSSFTSKTSFPELVIENVTNSAFYDCPGFKDTRSTAQDISTTYFIKKVLDFSRRVKLVFVVGYSTVRIGGSRDAFTDLLRHITRLLNHVDDFEDGLAMVVTKVDNSYQKKGGKLVMISDNDVIDGIAEFLSGLLVALNNEKDKNFGMEATKIVDILLDKKDGSYTRIGIFRRPDEDGSLDRNALLQEGKQNINRVIHKNINFTATEPDTFGYTISKNSKLALLSMVDELNDFVIEVMREFASDIILYYDSLFQKRASTVANELRLASDTFTIFVSSTEVNTIGTEFIDKLIDSIRLTQINITTTQLDEIHKKFIFVFFLEKVSGLRLKTRALDWVDSFRPISMSIETGVSNMQSMIAANLEEILKHHTNNITIYFNSLSNVEGEYKTSVLEKAIKSVPVLKSLIEHSRTLSPNSLYSAFLEFFNDSRVALDEDTTDLSNNLNDIISLESFGPLLINETLIANISSSLLGSESEIKTKLASVANEINSLIERLSAAIRDEIDEKFVEIKNKMRLNDKLELIKKRLSVLANAKGANINQLNLTEFFTGCQEIGLAMDEFDLRAVVDYEPYSTELSGITNVLISFDSMSYKLYAPALIHLNVQTTWYTYLDKLSNALNSQTVQTNRNGYNLNRFNQHGTTSFSNRIRILDSLSSSSDLSDFQPTQTNVDELNSLNVLTLSNSKTSCPGNGLLLVTGYNIRMSEIVNANCPSYQYSKLVVFAYNAVYFDSDYTNQNNIQMSIISPRWYIISPVTINLSGSDGLDQTETAPGEMGRPGYPGGQGGSLFALASSYDRADLLTVNVNGGNGGNGQTGGDGVRGRDGDNAELPTVGLDDCFKVTSSFRTDFKKQYSRRLSVFEGQTSDYIHSTCTIHGRMATNGKSGGDGGVGGEGGYSGNVQFIELTGAGSSNSVVIKKDNGRVGNGGSGGQRGKGGRNGDTIETKCSPSMWIIFIRARSHEDWHVTNRLYNGFASDGSRGRDNYNSGLQIRASDNNQVLPVKNAVNQYIRAYSEQRDDSTYLFDKSIMIFVEDLRSRY